MAGPRPLRIAPLLLLAGCAQLNYVVEVTVKEEVTTVVELSWATQDPGISWVEYGVASRFEHSTPSTHDESLAHVHTLLGLPPYQEVLYRAVTLVDGEELIVDGSVSTGGLPPELPELRVSAHQPELASPGPYLMGTMLGYAGGIFTIDREGRWLWYRLSPEATDPVEIAMDRSGPGFIYYGIPQEHGITASADVEMRYRGDVLWRARVHEQGIVNLSGFSDEDFLRDTARGSEREPWLSYTITTTLARLTKKILATAKQQNELLRSGS